MARTTKQVNINLRHKQAADRMKHVAQAPKLPLKDLRALVEELHTYQIELETQNEDLQRARREADEARARYAELYEYAPVGYFTFDAQGVIKSVNMTGAELLGLDKGRLLGVPFTRFIEKEDHKAFARHLRDVQAMRTKQACEFRLLRPDKALLSVALQSVAPENGSVDGIECRTTVIDISERKAAEELNIGLNKHLELMNAELDAERSRWQGVVEGIADEVWTCDSEGRMSLVNLSVVTAMGLTAFRNKSVHEVLHEVDILNPDGTLRPPEQSPLLRSLTGEIVRGQELMRHRESGRVRWRHYSSAPMRDESGAITGAVAIVRDITDLKEAEEALRESEVRLKTIASTALDAIILIDNDGNVSFWNEAATKVFGYSEEEIMGKYLHAFIMPERHADRYWKGFETFRTTGKGPLVGTAYEIEAKRKDGTEFPVELALSALKLKGAWCAVGIVRDITERKRAELELTTAKQVAEKRAKEAEEGQRILDAIMEYAPEGVAISDERGRVTAISKEGLELTGMPIEELRKSTAAERHPIMGIYMADGVTPAAYDDIPMNKVLRTGDSVKNQELLIKRRNSREIPVLVSAGPIRDAEGNIKGTVHVWRDITELKQAEKALKRTLDELARSNRELDQFASVASHDLQAPLRTIAGFAGLLAEHYQGKLDEKADQHIARILNAAKRMSVLIHDLYVYARLGANATPHQPVEMASALAGALENLSKAVEESRAEITSDELPRVVGDHVQLVQLFQNLIGNAITFRKRDTAPKVRISAERTENSWTFGVHDNGIGIEPRFFERIFVIFQRLHAEAEYPGTGTGLALCKKIVELHGGRLWVESKPGEGSSFYFTLPAAQPSP